jgi:hypothetical protein
MARSVPPRTRVVAKEVPQDVGRGLVVDSGPVEDGGEHGAGAACAESAAAVVEEHSRCVGARPGPACGDRVLVGGA